MIARLLYWLAAAVLIVFAAACFIAVVAAIVLALLPAVVGAAGCPIGYPACVPDTVSPAWVFAPVIVGGFYELGEY